MSQFKPKRTGKTPEWVGTLGRNPHGEGPEARHPDGSRFDRRWRMHTPSFIPGSRVKLSSRPGRQGRAS